MVLGIIVRWWCASYHNKESNRYGKRDGYVHVYDTWVKGKNGKLHFDVMTTSRDKALANWPNTIWWGIGEPEAVDTPKNASSATANRSSCFPWSSSASFASRVGSSSPAGLTGQGQQSLRQRASGGKDFSGATGTSWVSFSVAKWKIRNTTRTVNG